MIRKAAVVLQTPGALPVLLWGDTGIGKSSQFGQLAKLLEWESITVIGAGRLPEDFAGVLVPGDGGRPQRIPDDYVFDAIDLVAAGRKVLLFFDEISCAPPAVQAVLLSAILDLRFGSIRLPADSVRVAAAANPADVAAGGFELSDPLAARFTHVEEPARCSDFQAWLREGDGAGVTAPKVPLATWERHYGRGRALLDGYLQRFPSHQIESPKERLGREPKRFATRRTWDNGLRLWASGQAMGDSDLALELAKDAVGPLALQFLAWAEDNDLPEPEELLRRPASWKHEKKRPDRTYAILSLIASYVGVHKERWTEALPVVLRAMHTGAAGDEITPAVITLANGRPEDAFASTAAIEYFKEIAGVVIHIQRLAEAL